MEPLSRAWIDRIFERLECLLKDRWSGKGYPGHPEKIEKYKTIWSTSLIGMNAEEIKKALKLSENLQFAPTSFEFYRFGKGIEVPYISSSSNSIKNWKKGSPIVANKYITDIKSKLSNHFQCST